jgi:NADP-dependent 3-hydroxy acid dehydrogenase YdfG
MQSALIVGAGAGLSASLARLFVKNGLRVTLAARDTGKLAALCGETGAKAIAADATQPADVAHAIAVSAYGGFLVAQQALQRMLPRGEGAILFTGASASVKGYAQSAAFAMGKFALRGLAQSMAREFCPQGIHIAHFVIDGGIRSATRTVPEDKPDSLLDPDDIAATYWHVLTQNRSAWTWEVELRPWVERF